MKSLRIHHSDNVEVALSDLAKGSVIGSNGSAIELVSDVPAKHKYALRDFDVDDDIIMYGVLVGKAVTPILKGEIITTSNIRHATNNFSVGERKSAWAAPDVSTFTSRTFNGYHRADGSVGTANHWLIIPMVFCENKNVQVLQDAFTKALGYEPARSPYQSLVHKLTGLYQSGMNEDQILETNLSFDPAQPEMAPRLFPNIDGIKFLTHTLGCGGTRQDARALCGLLAGYVTHPNVAGATVLSLGCQNAQMDILKEEIAKRDSAFSKPVVYLEQQQIGNETKLLELAVQQTFAALVKANQNERRPAPLSKLCIGLECGGSDGFSGISANPAIGYTSDLVVALGGSVILSEFPELNGVEQELTDRCVSDDIAVRFGELMRTYNERAMAVGSGFHANPSPGNIKDGLITDAIKSAGAAKKGGTSPI
ncbi:MAG TPA: UxaA family hydrolase, partial [Flavitalea sp.]|nr:UxaA family hydrolase [Flavitalea sp.]